MSAVMYFMHEILYLKVYEYPLLQYEYDEPAKNSKGRIDK